MKSISLTLFVVFFFQLSNAQNIQSVEFGFSGGYNNTTISHKIKGMYIQTDFTYEPLRQIGIRLSVGMNKASEFPKRFSYQLQPFSIYDTIWGPANNDLWQLVKNYTAYNLADFGLMLSYSPIFGQKTGIHKREPVAKRTKSP